MAGTALKRLMAEYKREWRRRRGQLGAATEEAVLGGLRGVAARVLSRAGADLAAGLLSLLLCCVACRPLRGEAPHGHSLARREMSEEEGLGPEEGVYEMAAPSALCPCERSGWLTRAPT